MHKMKFNGAWLDTVIELDKEYPLPVEILIDKIKREGVPPNEVRIVVLWEPTGYLISDVMRHPSWYTKVFTYHPFILDNNEKAVFFLGVTCFARPTIIHEKTFTVSTVIGHKRNIIFPGYDKRHELWFRRNQITGIQEQFYLSGKQTYKEPVISTKYGDIHLAKERRLGEWKDEVFCSMFHIAIENVFERNWFTEKVVDCFLKKTVPIYIGCENIGDHFNTDGIIHVKTVDEIIDVCNGLTEADYYSRLDAMEDNYQRSLQYLDYNKMISDKVREVLP